MYRGVPGSNAANHPLRIFLIYSHHSISEIWEPQYIVIREEHDWRLYVCQAHIPLIRSARFRVDNLCIYRCAQSADRTIYQLLNIAMVITRIHNNKVTRQA